MSMIVVHGLAKSEEAVRICYNAPFYLFIQPWLDKKGSRLQNGDM